MTLHNMQLVHLVTNVIHTNLNNYVTAKTVLQQLKLFKRVKLISLVLYRRHWLGYMIRDANCSSSSMTVLTKAQTERLLLKLL